MKKIFGILCGIMLLGLAMPSYALGSQSFGKLDYRDSVVTTAEIEAADAEFADHGLLPNHPLYFMKTATEKFRLFFASEDDRAKLHLKFARMRLAEAKKLAEQGENPKEAVSRFNMEINKTRGIKTVAVEAEVLRGKSIIVLSHVLERVPEQAKPAIEAALNNSMQKIDAGANVMEVRKEIEEARNATTKDRIEREKKSAPRPLKIKTGINEQPAPQLQVPAPQISVPEVAKSGTLPQATVPSVLQAIPNPI